MAKRREKTSWESYSAMPFLRAGEELPFNDPNFRNPEIKPRKIIAKKKNNSRENNPRKPDQLDQVREFDFTPYLLR